MISRTAPLASNPSFVHGWRVPALNLLFAGGVLFALSDLVLSGTYFGEGKERPVDLILNYLNFHPNSLDFHQNLTSY